MIKDISEVINFSMVKLSSPEVPAKEKLFYLDISCYLREYKALHRMLKELGSSLPELEFGREDGSVEAVRKFG